MKRNRHSCAFFSMNWEKKINWIMSGVMKSIVPMLFRKKSEKFPTKDVQMQCLIKDHEPSSPITITSCHYEGSWFDEETKAARGTFSCFSFPLSVHNIPCSESSAAPACWCVCDSIFHTTTEPSSPHWKAKYLFYVKLCILRCEYALGARPFRPRDGKSVSQT